MANDPLHVVAIERPDDLETLTCTFEPLPAPEVDSRLRKLARPESVALDAHKGARADAVSFQPCVAQASQDRHITRTLLVCGQQWIFTGVFDGMCFGVPTLPFARHWAPRPGVPQLRSTIADTHGAVPARYL
jgi:hypothetical protein